MIRTAIAATVLGSCTAAGAGPGNLTSAVDPGCQEDQVAVVAPDNGVEPGLDWVCVTLDDFADQASIDRLDELLADDR